MAKTYTPSLNVIIDTKEKTPWALEDPKVMSREYTSLKTGDYTLVGAEEYLCIERKSSVTEIAGNITTARFKRELERIQKIPYSYLIFEFSAQDIFNYPASANLSPAILAKIRMNGVYLMRCLNRMQVRYGFNIIYAGNRYNAERIAINLMEDVATELRCQKLIS